MNEATVDNLIIGGGPGGTPIALALARAGQQVMLVEQGPGLGGTCLFEGCIPSKIFRETARRVRELREALDFGLCLPTRDLHIDWSAVQARKRRLLDRRAKAALGHTSQLPSLEVVTGSARLLSSRSALVTTPDGGERTVTFKQAVLATGSVPFRPPIPGIDHDRVLDSEGLLAIDRIPEDLVVIGGGPIGVELGQVFLTLGSRVTLLEASPHILGPVDRELAARLQRGMQADGIEIITDCQVRAINNTGGGGVYVEYTPPGSDPTHRFADTVLLVTGRRPRVAGLGLEATAVRHDPHGVKVDEQLQTDEPGIYAIGDLLGQPMFAHWATAQGLALARHLLGLPVVFPRPQTNSAVIFSEPELGMVGLTEAQARASGVDVAVATYDYAQDARAQIAGRDSGLLKIVYARDSRQVLGVHALVEGADDLMGEAAIAIAAGLSIEALAGAIHPHPTLSESFGLAARAALAGEQPAADK